MKKYLFLVGFIFINMAFALESTTKLKRFCEDAVGAVQTFKSRELFKTRSLEILNQKAQSEISKFPDRESEILKKKNTDMRVLLRVHPLDLCEDDKVLTEVSKIKEMAGKKYDRCLKVKNPKAILNSLGSDSSDIPPSKNLDSDLIEARKDLVRNSIYLGGLDLNEKPSDKCVAIAGSIIKGKGKYIHGESLREYCRHSISVLNEMMSIGEKCEKEQERKFSDDQLFKCSMGQDPLKNCPSPDPEDVKTWENRSKNKRVEAKKVRAKSHERACEEGNQKACRSQVILRNRALSN